MKVVVATLGNIKSDFDFFANILLKLMINSEFQPTEASVPRLSDDLATISEVGALGKIWDNTGFRSPVFPLGRENMKYRMFCTMETLKIGNFFKEKV